MVLVKFMVKNLSNQETTLECDERDTIGVVLGKIFPQMQSYTIQLCSKKLIRILDRKEIVRAVIKETILIDEEVTLRIIDLKEYIDIYINRYTQKSLKLNENKVRIYVNEDTQIEYVEKELQSRLNTSSNIYGLYGYYKKDEEKIVFKLKKSCYVLFLKRCFEARNFFQHQYNENYESLENIKPNYEGCFYRIDNFEQRLIFKKTHRYSLRENTLIRLKGGRIYDCFYNINKSKVTSEKFYGKNIIRLENIDKVWNLCTFDAKNHQNMYNAIVSSGNFGLIREIEDKSMSKHAVKQVKEDLNNPRCKKDAETQAANHNELNFTRTKHEVSKVDLNLENEKDTKKANGLGHTRSSQKNTRKDNTFDNGKLKNRANEPNDTGSKDEDSKIVFGKRRVDELVRKEQTTISSDTSKQTSNVVLKKPKAKYKHTSGSNGKFEKDKYYKQFLKETFARKDNKNETDVS